MVVKIIIACALLTQLLATLYTHLFVKKHFQSHELMVAMGVYPKNDVAKNKYLVKKALPSIIFVIISFLGHIASIIGLFFTRYWCLGIIFIISILRFNIGDRPKDKNGKEKKTLYEIIMDIIQYVILIFVLIFL